jgi:hypothetical protein
MLRFYASIRHICGGRTITIVGSGLTITTAAIDESSEAAERCNLPLGGGPAAE